MNRRMQLIRAVALEADALYEQSASFGRQMAKDVAGDRGRSQVTGLEAIANSTLKVGDILDYIKRQTARHKEWQADSFGARLLNLFTMDLNRRRDVLASRLGATEEEKQQLTLLLYREFIRQMAAQDAFSRTGTA